MKGKRIIVKKRVSLNGQERRGKKWSDSKIFDQNNFDRIIEEIKSNRKSAKNMENE